MFRRRKGGNTEEGNVCPYCKFVNEDAVESCAQCYYSMNLAARDQPMATPSTSGSDLLDTLMGDTELEEEEMTVEAVLSLEDVSVEVDPYEEVKQEDKDDFQFISGSSPTLSKTVEFETPDEVELDVSDAPANPVVFDMGDADPLGVPMEPVPIGLGKLYSPSVKTEKDDDLMGSIGPVAGQTTATPEIPDFTNLTQVKQKSPSEPVQETPQGPYLRQSHLAEPAVSEVPIVPVTPEVPNLNSAPSTPELPTVAEHTQAPPTPEFQRILNPALWPQLLNSQQLQMLRKLSLKPNNLPQQPLKRKLECGRGLHKSRGMRIKSIGKLCPFSIPSNSVNCRRLRKLWMHWAHTLNIISI